MALSGKRPTPAAALLQGLALLIAAALPALAAWAWHPRAPSLHRAVSEISLEEAKALDGAFWVDARIEEAYREAHAPGAIPVNVEDWEGGFERLLMEWNLVAPIVVYCSSQACQRSLEVAERLRRDLAFDQVYVLEGGWETWRGAGEPTEQ